MRQLIAISTLLLASPLAFAQAAPASPHTVTGNVGFATQYVFRGLTQTDERAAVQGGFDYSHASGFYAGIWGSNISWFTDSASNNTNSASLEVDLYGGYKNSFPMAKDLTYDVGILRYEYPGRYPSIAAGNVKPNTTEIYGALGYKWVSFKYSYSLDDTFGIANSDGSWYADLSAAIPVADTGFSVGLHAGHQEFRGKYFANTQSNDALYSYDDYKISLNKEFKGFNFSLAFTDSNAKDGYKNAAGRNIGDSHTVFSVSKSF